MEKILTMAEIEKKYVGQWVLIAEPEIDEALDVVRGRVVFHSPDRDEFDRKSLEFTGGHVAVQFIGEPSRDMEFVLCGPVFGVVSGLRAG